MTNFDDIATDSRLKLKDIEAFISTLRDDALFAGRYWLAATSGSSGLRSIIPTNRTEWASIIASYGRASEWSGIRISPFRSMRMAVVSSTTPIHQSARVGQSVATPLLHTLRLDASSNIENIIQQLNNFQPRILVAYASMLNLLAEAQIAGALRISPDTVNSSSETLTAAMRERIRRAWREPFEAYAATETGGIAAECDRHLGLHIFEDLVVVEAVNDAYEPVPEDVQASRILVSVLSSRSLPLIRYELTDRIRITSRRCDCGRPFRLIQEVEGRSDDVLLFTDANGRSLSLHPMHFHKLLDAFACDAWQVRQRGNSLQILLASRETRTEFKSLEDAIRATLNDAGLPFV